MIEQELLGVDQGQDDVLVGLAPGGGGIEILAVLVLVHFLFIAWMRATQFCRLIFQSTSTGKNTLDLSGYNGQFMQFCTR